MKSIVKSIILLLAGALTAGALLFGYSYLVRNIEDNSLGFVEIEPGDAVISHISGEVFLIREEKMIVPKPGDSVRQGDIIKVVDDSWCQVDFVGKATMNLRSNTLVEIQRLLTNSRDIDVRTELLTGSMLYKVDRLNATDNLEVRAQERIYRVEGTEFYIESHAGAGSRVSVREGTVAVLQTAEGGSEEIISRVPAGESLDLTGWEAGAPVPENSSLSSQDRELFKKESPSVQENAARLVYLEITARPEGAQLYQNGRLSRSGRLSGLFDPDTPLTLLARKRGYEDLSLKITPGELESSKVVLQMKALGLRESLQEEADNEPGESPEEMKERYDRELESLSDDFSDRIRESSQRLNELQTLSSSLEAEISRLSGDNSSLAEEKKALEDRLDESLEEQRKLRELLIQIQELSAEQ